jgi:hypothetical protein
VIDITNIKDELRYPGKQRKKNRGTAEKIPLIRGRSEEIEPSEHG